MPRLFVAIRPPPAIIDALIDIQGGVEGARWQDEEQLHITLRFIGEVDGHTADDIAATLETVAATRFRIALAGLGTFARKGRVDTLWAGVAPAAPLAALHRKIDHALVRLGLPPEGRAYKPHITIARLPLRGAGPVDGFLARHGGLASAPFTVDRFALVESVIGRDGARYRDAISYALD